MSFDPADPEPVLETYDPNWEPRFDAIHARLKVLQERDWFLRDHELCKLLTKELIDAHEAQFQFAWQLDKALRERHGGLPRAVDPTLRIPSPPHTASPAEMEAHYAKWREGWEYRWFVALLPPAVEWETGVFAQTPPAGVTRTVQEATIEAPRMCLPVRMTLVVERHPGTTHVCAIQGPEGGASVTNNLDLVAGWVAERYLPRPGLLAGLLAGLGGPAPRLVLHHTYTPRRHGPRQQLVWRYELRWARRRLRIDELEAQEATPYLRNQSLELAPEARSDMALS